MKDDGSLTLTFPVDGKAVDRTLVRLPPPEREALFDLCVVNLGRQTRNTLGNERRQRRRRPSDAVPAPWDYGAKARH